MSSPKMSFVKIFQGQSKTYCDWSCVRATGQSKTESATWETNENTQVMCHNSGYIFLRLYWRMENSERVQKSWRKKNQPLELCIKQLLVILVFCGSDCRFTVCLGMPCPSGPPFPSAVNAALLAFMASFFFCSAIFCRAKNLFFRIWIRLAM